MWLTLLPFLVFGQTTNEDTEEEDNPEEEVISLKGSSAPEESADSMGAPISTLRSLQKSKVF